MGALCPQESVDREKNVYIAGSVVCYVFPQSSALRR